MKFVITESDREHIRSLYEQDTRVKAVPLSNTNFQNLDIKSKQEIIRSLMTNQDIKTKLELPKNTSSNFDIISFMNKKGVTPYIFMKHIPSSGEKFGMMGVYVDLFGEDISMKLNLNNVSDYMVNSLPWALLSLNVKL
jgi:hypothetical protein